MGILSTNKKIINLGQGYSAGSGISIDDYVISVTGDTGTTYSAGPNIDIYDDQGQLYISGKDWSADIANASSNAYEQATALIPPEFDPSYISGVVDNKLDTTAFSTVSGDYATTSYVDMSDNLTYSRATAWGNQNLAPLNSVADNSAKWNEIEVYEQNSATYLTAHQDISNKLDTTAFSTVSGTFLTAHQVIPSAKWEDASDVVQSNSAQWSENTGDEEVNNAVYNNSAKWNDISVYQTNSANYLTAHQDISNKLDTTAFSTVSGTFLTAHQPISANEWNSVYETVETNSGSWTGGGTSLTGDAQGAVDEVYSNSANWSDISAYQSNSANYMTNLFIAKYGQSTYAEVEDAVTSNKIVYCKATPNGTSTRMAFLAYIGTNNYEFQYYRSLNNHNISNQGDEVYIYTCNRTGTTWTSSMRYAYTQISASKGLSGYYTNGTYRLAATGAATTGDLNTVSGILSGAIDYLSGNAGKTYTGISPIVVNNTTNEISADSQDITFGEGLDFTNGVLTVTGAGTTYTGDAQGALDEVYANSGVWLTAHQDISNKLDTTAFSTVSGNFLTAVDLTPYYTTADANTLSSMLSGAIDYVSANAGDEFPASANEAITTYQNASGTYLTAHQDISNKLDTTAFSDVSGTFLTAINIPESADWNDATTAYQTNSATYLTAHQVISAEEWNSNYDTVYSNSSTWTNGGFTGEVYGISGVSPNVDVYIDQQTLWISAGGFANQDDIDYLSGAIGDVETLLASL